MANKNFTGAPFGIQKSRFDVNILYPERRRPGTYTEVVYDKKATGELFLLITNRLERKLAPGYYNSNRGSFSSEAVARRASGPGWAREQEIEKFAHTPQMYYKEKKQNQKFMEMNRGPGKYNLPYFLDLLEKKNPETRGVCDTREQRFKERDNYTPGPGTYGKGGIPSALLEEKQQLSPGKLGLLDSKDLKSRAPMIQGCDLGPGTYNIENSIDKLLTRVVSKRGPYDLFTGSRSSRIITGHRATKPLNLTPGMYKFKSFTSELLHPEKRRHGKLGTVAQYPFPPTDRIYYSTLSQWQRPKSYPGYYLIKPLSKPENRKPPPFLTSTTRGSFKSAKLFTFNPNNVGVGRYDTAKYDRNRPVNPFKSCFLSKTQRYLSNFTRDKVLQERLKPTKPYPAPQGSSITLL